MRRGFPWKTFFSRLYDLAFEADILSRAAQVAFYFSFAIFPLLLFLISLAGIVLDSSDNIKSEVFASLRQLMPATAFDLLHKTVEEVVASSTSGKLTIGLIATLWSASAGLDAIRNALNAIYRLNDKRPWLKTKLQSVVLTFVLIVLGSIAVSVTFYGWELIHLGAAAIGVQVSSPLVLAGSQWLAMLIVVLLGCEVFYNLLPAFDRFRWVWITPGSVVAIILWVALTTAFRMYVTYFNSYNKAYGSLGAVIVLMLWLYLTATALMVGGAINAVLAELTHSDPASPDLAIDTDTPEDPDLSP